MSSNDLSRRTIEQLLQMQTGHMSLTINVVDMDKVRKRLVELDKKEKQKSFWSRHIRYFGYAFICGILAAYNKPCAIGAFLGFWAHEVLRHHSC